MSNRCGSVHVITRLRCRLARGHAGDHEVICRLSHCGGFGSEHRWPR